MVRQSCNYGLVERTVVERRFRDLGWMAGCRPLLSRYVSLSGHHGQLVLMHVGRMEYMVSVCRTQCPR